MFTSSRLRVSDLRAIYELAGECRDLGDDPAVWWRHLFEQAARLVDADIATGGETLGEPTGPDNTLEFSRCKWVGTWGFAENGFSLAGLEWALVEYRSNPRFDPFITAAGPAS